MRPPVARTSPPLATTSPPCATSRPRRRDAAPNSDNGEIVTVRAANFVARGAGAPHMPPITLHMSPEACTRRAGGCTRHDLACARRPSATTTPRSSHTPSRLLSTPPGVRRRRAGGCRPALFHAEGDSCGVEGASGCARHGVVAGYRAFFGATAAWRRVTSSFSRDGDCRGADRRNGPSDSGNPATFAGGTRVQGAGRRYEPGDRDAISAESSGQLMRIFAVVAS